MCFTFRIVVREVRVPRFRQQGLLLWRGSGKMSLHGSRRFLYVDVLQEIGNFDGFSQCSANLKLISSAAIITCAVKVCVVEGVHGVRGAGSVRGRACGYWRGTGAVPGARYMMVVVPRVHHQVTVNVVHLVATFVLVTTF